MTTKYIQHKDWLILQNGKHIFRGVAQHPRSLAPGESADLTVAIVLEKDGLFPGICEVTVNLNHWKVYKTDDPELTEVLIKAFFPRGD